MSKRFGRNQKRKMREEISRIRNALTLAEGLLRHTSAEKAQLAETLAEARYIMGDDVALPPRMCGNHPNPLGRDWDSAPVMKLDLLEYVSHASMEPVAFQRMRMHTLLVDWEQSKLHDRVHVRTTLDSGDVAYNISNAALYGMPRDALQMILTREIARSVSKLMVEKLRPA